MKTLKVLSALLSYPSDELVAACGELHDVIDREAVLGAEERAGIHALIDSIEQGDLFDLQERYILAPVRARSRREPRPGPGYGRSHQSL